MKKIITFLYAIAIIFVTSCGTTYNYPDTAGGGYVMPANLKNVVYHGGNGRTQEEAIIISHAKNEKTGIAAEYAYIERNYGARETGWKLVQQSVNSKGNKKYDVLLIYVKELGENVTLYFDITEFYGKF